MADVIARKTSFATDKSPEQQFPDWAQDALREAASMRSRTKSMHVRRDSLQASEHSLDLVKDDSSIRNIDQLTADVDAFHRVQDMILNSLRQRLSNLGVRFGNPELDDEDVEINLIASTPTSGGGSLSAVHESSGSNSRVASRNTSPAGSVNHTPSVSPHVGRRRMGFEVDSDDEADDWLDMDLRELEYCIENEIRAPPTRVHPTLHDNAINEIPDNVSSTSDDGLEMELLRDPHGLYAVLYCHTPFLFLNESCFVEGGSANTMASTAMKGRMLGVIGPNLNTALLVRLIKKEGGDIEQLSLRDATSVCKIRKTHMTTEIARALDCTESLGDMAMGFLIRSRRSRSGSLGLSKLSGSVAVLRRLETVVDASQALALVQVFSHLCTTEDSSVIVPFGCEQRGGLGWAQQNFNIRDRNDSCRKILQSMHNLCIFNNSHVIFSGTPGMLGNYIETHAGGLNSRSNYIDQVLYLENAHDVFKKSALYKALMFAAKGNGRPRNADDDGGKEEALSKQGRTLLRQTKSNTEGGMSSLARLRRSWFGR